MAITGKLLYHFYFRPRSWLRSVNKSGGLINFIKIEKAKKSMIKSAQNLLVNEPPLSAINIYFLTGKKYWPLTAFCMYSLAKVSTMPLRPVFIDDGSLDEKFINKIIAQFPGCIIKTAAETEIIIKQKLPVNKYPFLHKKRAIYSHIKKLIDVHAGSSGWKMVLDSDMLFFKPPVEMLDWLKQPEKPFFLYDPISSYYYSLWLMEKLAGNKINPNINVGVAGLKSEDINWDELEYWIKTLEEKGGTNYLLEQALSAMLVAGKEITIADRAAYIVMPDKSDVESPSAVLHHYVAESKEWYFKSAWKAVIK
jgi:hypothetical protein